MNIEDLPILIVSLVQSDSPQLMGRVNRWQWVGEGHIAYLYLDANKPVEGKFCNVDESTKSVSFAFKHPDSATKIIRDESIPYFDGYWEERALIVFDQNLVWEECTFKPRDAIKTYHDGRTDEIPGGWDHEHCDICWATISQKENQVFMKSSQGDCVCLNCFTNHVKAKNIDFIQEA